MDDLHIPIEANDANWRQRCNERVERLKTRELSRQDVRASQPTLLHLQKLVMQEKFMPLELYEAVESGDVDSFVNALEQVCEEKDLPLSAIFDQVTEAGDSLLHLAADCGGSSKIVELIASHYPGLLIKTNIKGDTPLHVASRARNYDAMGIILSYFAATNVNQEILITRLQNEFGDTALHEAAVAKWFEGVALVFDADRDVAHCLNKSAKSPLYLAVLTGDVRILLLLLDSPFPHNQPLPQCHGNSPLHAAILERNPAMLEKILESKEELMYLKDEDGGTALHYAAYVGYAEGVRILLNKSTLIAAERNSKGYFPIHLASKKGRVKVVEEFIKKEWPNAKNMLSLKGQNILHIAAKNGNSKVVNYLLRNTKLSHSIINKKDKDGNTPLHLASRNLCTMVLYSLTRHKEIDMNLTNNEGLTPRDIIWFHSKSPRTRRELLSSAILRSAGAPVKAHHMSHIRRQETPNTEWNVKDTANTLILVGILIVTVTFAASFTVPGGVYSSDHPESHKRGMAVLADKSLFRIFMGLNTVAMYSSTVGSMLLLWVLLGDRHLALAVLGYASAFLHLALFTMAGAFFAAVRLVVSNSSVLADVITVLGFIFIFVMIFCLVLGLFPLGIRLPLLRQVGELVIWIFIVLAFGVFDKMNVKESKRSRGRGTQRQQEPVLREEISISASRG